MAKHLKSRPATPVFESWPDSWLTADEAKAARNV